MNTNPILIIAGEPFSIFSEILFKSTKKDKFKKPLILIGSLKLFQRQMQHLRFKSNFNLIKQDFLKKELKKGMINIIDVNLKFKKPFEKISNRSKNYNKKCFDVALDILKKHKIAGLINGPISKKHFLKKNFYGITEYLAAKTKTKKFAMLIYNKKLSVCPITTHLALKDVSKNISKKNIINKVILIKNFYKKFFKINASIGITGLNPHCESNYENSEERKIITPAIKELSKIYSKIYGPFPADSIFMKNNKSKFDVIVGMYHDQVLTPIKSIYDFDAINITLGLPFIRVSPDHGTNNDMAGKNLSDPQSLIKAIKFLDQR